MDNWILLTILYTFFVSFSEVSKKKATKKSSVYEVLAGFTLISCIISFFMTNDVFSIDYNYLPIILFKTIVTVIAWVLSLMALTGLQLSIYGMIKISRIIFTVLLSYLLLGESLTLITLIGMIIIIIGLILVNINSNDTNKKNSMKLKLLFLVSCFFTSISSIIDKQVLLHVSSGQFQFWFLLFSTIFYWILLFINNGKKKLNIRKMCSNYWILIVALFIVFGDRLLYMANSIPSSSVIVITMLKQLSVVISIILGKIIFNEKNIIKKLLYSVLILSGVLLIIVF